MITSITLGKKTFPCNLISAPLAGFSAAPFRALIWRYSKPAFCVTEMVSCAALVRSSKLTLKRFMAKDPEEGPVCFQLLSNNVQELAEATKIVTDQGADLIDLNCGCAVKKVRRNGEGSALLAEPTKIYQMITAMKQNTHLPVSIKIRVDGANITNGKEKFNNEIVKVVSDAGADFITVHGRSFRDHYDTPCNYDEIKFFVETLKIPVIGNGDVSDLASLQKMVATGASGAMVGRAMIGQPWLIGKLIAEANGEKFISPTPQEIGAIFFEHIARLKELLESEKIAILQARTLVGHYVKALPERRKFCIALNACNTILEFKKLCEGFFGAARLS